MEYGIDLSRRPTPRSPVRDAGRFEGHEPVTGKEVRARIPAAASREVSTMFRKIGFACLALVAALAVSVTAQAESLRDILKAGLNPNRLQPEFSPPSSHAAQGDSAGI